MRAEMIGTMSLMPSAKAPEPPESLWQMMVKQELDRLIYGGIYAQVDHTKCTPREDNDVRTITSHSLRDRKDRR